jgi:hypothetical protein
MRWPRKGDCRGYDSSLSSFIIRIKVKRKLYRLVFRKAQICFIEKVSAVLRGSRKKPGTELPDNLRLSEKRQAGEF